LAGEAAHALRILEGLRGEGVEAAVVLWALAREIRLLANLAQLQESGTPLERAFTQVKPPVWDKRRPLMTRALQRHGARRLEALLRDAQVADEQIKGQAPGDVWLTLTSLALVLAGKRLALGKPLQ
ncbi:DNA polymerase III subunit delta, partial [Pseudomonas oryzihabitans]